MARNIEIKARIDNYDELVERAAAMAEHPPLSYRQHDTFYEVPSGRLKLRRFDDGSPAELIFYQRDDADGPKVSFYMRSPVTNVEATQALFAAALKIRGNVSKERLVYLVDRSRIQLDRVEGLGDFVEIEVVLAQDDDEATGEKEAFKMFEKLGIPSESFVPGSYIDLLNAR
ncbi:class IV adenylate cyclase [Burkholderia sp. L27(2015)]|uniref:class IV adenylate cyclase n=1 Tax=Burkholderia sp. L27(2015) TaxID=1641858 RepID=UPI00131D13A3|nr:class IV adenylate cyclase [Burkholderia sp. L27(2015)]